MHVMANIDIIYSWHVRTVYIEAYLRNTCTNTNISYKTDINQTEQVFTGWEVNYLITSHVTITYLSGNQTLLIWNNTSSDFPPPCPASMQQPCEPLKVISYCRALSSLLTRQILFPYPLLKLRREAKAELLRGKKQNG